MATFDHGWAEQPPRAVINLLKSHLMSFCEITGSTDSRKFSHQIKRLQLPQEILGTIKAKHPGGGA